MNQAIMTSRSSSGANHRSVVEILLRTTNDLFLVGLRQFFGLKVAFIAPREEGRT